MKEHEVVINFEGKSLKIANEEIFMAVPVASHRVKLVLGQGEEIPPRIEKHLMVRLKDNAHDLRVGLIEAEPVEKGLLVARSLVQLEDTVPVRILNTNDYPMELKKRKTVGRVGVQQ